MTQLPRLEPAVETRRPVWRDPKWRRLASIGGLVLVLLAAGTAPAHAMERLNGGDVVVAAGEVIDDDLFVIAQSFTLDGEVNGDLIVVAGSIIINGKVQDDLVGIGQTLVINGEVGDDVRFAALAIDLGPTAGLSDDILSAAVRFEGRRGSRIEGQMLHLGLQTIVGGSVGSATPTLAKPDITDPTDTDSEATDSAATESATTDPTTTDPTATDPTATDPTDTPAPGGSTGLLAPPPGNSGAAALVAWRPESGLPTGRPSSPPSQDSPSAELGASGTDSQGSGTAPLDWLLAQLRRMAALLLVGLIVVWLIPDKAREGAEKLTRVPFPSLGWGVIAIPALVMAFMVVVLATLSMVYVIQSATLNDLLGLVLAVGTLALVALVVVWILAVSYLGYIVVALAIGRLILGRLRPGSAVKPYFPLTLGTLILVLLMAIPGLGSAIGLIALLMGLGALWLLWREHGYAWRPGAPAAASEGPASA
jgi:hypothetical protein